MSLGAAAILTAQLDHAKALGLFEVARAGEFKTMPPLGLTFSVWTQTLGAAPDGSGLASTAGLLRTTARIMISMTTKPEDAAEIKLLQAADAYMARLSGDFTLGGLVRNVDLLSEMGEPMRWQFGYILIGDKMMRMADLEIYAVLNDLWTQAP
jgi:hypothetical protein